MVFLAPQIVHVHSNFHRLWDTTKCWRLVVDPCRFIRFTSNSTSSFTMLQFLGTHLPREVLFELELMLLQTHTVYKVRGKLSLGIFFKTIFDHHAQVACGWSGVNSADIRLCPDIGQSPFPATAMLLVIIIVIIIRIVMMFVMMMTIMI